jgi:hypothetical protein
MITDNLVKFSALYFGFTIEMTYIDIKTLRSYTVITVLWYYV